MLYEVITRARLEDGELRGQLTLVKQFGETQQLPFRATHGNEHAHEVPDPSARADLSGLV